VLWHRKAVSEHPGECVIDSGSLLEERKGGCLTGLKEQEHLGSLKSKGGDYMSGFVALELVSEIFPRWGKKITSGTWGGGSKGGNSILGGGEATLNGERNINLTMGYLWSMGTLEAILGREVRAVHLHCVTTYVSFSRALKGPLAGSCIFSIFRRSPAIVAGLEDLLRRETIIKNYRPGQSEKGGWEKFLKKVKSVYSLKKVEKRAYSNTIKMRGVVVLSKGG